MFTICHRDGQARVGLLQSKRGDDSGGAPIQTPHFLIYTYRGGAVNLTPDLLHELGGNVALQLNVLN